MIKKKKTVLKRVFALLGVVVVLLTSVLSFGVGATEQTTQVNHFSLGVLSNAELWLSDKTTLEEIHLDLDKIVLKTEAGSKEDGLLRYYLKLSDFMPYAKAGETYTLKMEISNNVDGVGIVNGISVGYGAKDNPNPTYWGNGKTRTLSQQDLDGYVSFYGYNKKTGGTSSVDVYTELRIAVVPEGQDYVFNYTEEEINYKNGFADGYEAGREEAYEEAKKYAYQEYLNQNTIVNPAHTTVTFIFDGTFISPPQSNAVLEHFDFGVYATTLNNNDYVFDGRSFHTANLTLDDYNISDREPVWSDNILDGLCGISVYVNTKNGATGAYTLAGDLPIQIDFGKDYAEDAIAIIEYSVPAGYAVPAGAVYVGDAYVCRKDITAVFDAENGVYYSTAEELFDIDSTTPVMAVRVTFKNVSRQGHGENMGSFDYKMASGRGVTFVNTKYDIGYLAGQKQGEREGYSSGYDVGKADGIAEGEVKGYDIGFRDGQIVAYNQGYSDGLKNAKELTFRGLMFAVVDAPVQVFSSMLNFEILGINLLGFLTSLLTIMIVIAVFKVVV